MKNYWAILVFRLVTVLLLALAPPASASLGGDEGTIETDRSSLAGPAYGKRNLGSYLLYEMGNNAIRVREYASPGGQVFAVSWAGTVAPDLRPLLGGYFTDFQQALQSIKMKTRRVRVPHRLLRGAEVTVETWGHFGAIRGRGYVGQLVPRGVRVNELP